MAMRGRRAPDCDVVVVGGGIAGSALATVLAREGLDVVVLERQEHYSDRVRGEGMWPWGVAEAQRLGLYDVLVEAGGQVTEQTVTYADGRDPQRAEATAAPLPEFVEGAPGGLNLGHPDACRAMVAAAVSEGARVEYGVSRLEVTPGPRPAVSYVCGGASRQLGCRLVVGADGRASRVRHQAGIELDHVPGAHMIAGMLVEGLHVDPTRNVMAAGADVGMITMPQGGGRARVYLMPRDEDAQRFSGSDGAERFMAASALDCVPESEAWAEAVPAGPCRTYPGGDTFTDRPFTDGVVLIGDAGGHNDPLIGQGLGLALRDVRALSEALLDGEPWETDTFARYGARRAERLRRMRFVAQLQATAMTTFGPEGRELRRGISRRQREDPSLLAPLLALLTGPDSLDPQVCTDGFRRRYLGLAA